MNRIMTLCRVTAARIKDLDDDVGMNSKKYMKQVPPNRIGVIILTVVLLGSYFRSLLAKSSIFQHGNHFKGIEWTVIALQ